MKQKIQILCIDCPFSFSDQLTQSSVARGADANYPTLTIEELKKLPIADITDPNGSILALWVPAALLQDGLDLMKTWQFDYKQLWSWIKIKQHPLEDLYQTIKECKQPQEIKAAFDNFDFNAKETSICSFGMGRLARNCSEIVLIGIRGKVYDFLEDRSQRNIFFQVNLKHSQKPEVLQDKLEAMFPKFAAGMEKSMMEIFARRKRNGWRCVGNEISGLDVREELATIIAE